MNRKRTGDQEQEERFADSPQNRTARQYARMKTNVPDRAHKVSGLEGWDGASKWKGMYREGSRIVEDDVVVVERKRGMDEEVELL